MQTDYYDDEVPSGQTNGSRLRVSSSSGGGLRSPNYPVTDIEGAIERIGKVYKSIRIGTQSPEFVAKSMGYKGLSGASRVMISTLRKFGLLEEGGKAGLRVTEQAKAIIMLPPSDPRYEEAVKECAFMPQIFAEMFETYGYDLPDDKPLQFYLVSKKFVPEVAIDVARNFRNTVEYVSRLNPQAESAEANNLTDLNVGLDSTRQSDTEQQAPIPHSNAPFGYETTAELHIPLPGGAKAHIFFEGILTQESVKRLTDYLSYFADDQPSKADIAEKITSN